MKQAVSAKKSIKKIAIGAGAALAIYVLLLALTSLLIVRGAVSESNIGVFVWIFACLAAFAGAKIAALGAGEPAVPIAGCVLAFWAVIQLLGFLVNDTLEPSRSAALALPVLAGGAVAYLLRGGKGKKGKRNRHSRK